LKIIFNHPTYDWYWQIYDELIKNHTIIVPENYRNEDIRDESVNLNILEKIVNETKNIDFIFDFKGDLINLIKWDLKKVDVPLVIFITNVIDRPYRAKKSIFANVWYVEQYAKPLMEKYNVDNLFYYGMATNPYIYFPLNIEKIYDVGFFGQHYGERKYWVKNLQIFSDKYNIKGYFPKGHGVNLRWTYEQINQFYNQTKINIAFAQKQKPGRIVNLRTFEICMSGNFQLMQYTPCVEEFFDVGEEIICWKTKNDLFEKINYYLKNSDERERIAENGYKRAVENHTWSKRFETIGSLLKSRKEIDLKKYIFTINQFHEDDEFEKIKNRNSSVKLFKYILKKYGLGRRILKKRKSIKINLKRNVFKYKYNLHDCYFIGFHGKILVVSKILKLNSIIRLNHWYDLKKIVYLTENADLSIPRFGIVTNGIQWVIYDFKNKIWLKRLPIHDILNTKINILKYLFLRIIYRAKKIYKLRLNLSKKSIFNIFLGNFKLVYTKITGLLGSDSNL